MALSNLAIRTLSAAILAPLVLGVVYMGGWPFTVMILLTSVGLAYEGIKLTAPSPRKYLWWAGIILYVAAFAESMLFVRKDNLGALLWLLAIVWSMDIGAYFAGKTIGGPKIAPKISPNKTWAGLIGGMVTAAIVTTIIWLVRLDEFALDATFVAMLFGGLSQIGDFLESWVKRKFGAKDSGNLIPGHGGLFDRLDGLVFAAILFAALARA